MKKQALYQAVTPIFGPLMGHRMGIVRMKMLLTQAQLAEKFGVSQNTISRLEAGGSTFCEAMTLAKMEEVFGGFLGFIVLGTNEHMFNVQAIRKHYHQVKYVEERKPGSGAWKKGNDLGAERLRDRVK